MPAPTFIHHSGMGMSNNGMGNNNNGIGSNGIVNTGNGTFVNKVGNSFSTPNGTYHKVGNNLQGPNGQTWMGVKNDDEAMGIILGNQH